LFPNLGSFSIVFSPNFAQIQRTTIFTSHTRPISDEMSSIQTHIQDAIYRSFGARVRTLSLREVGELRSSLRRHGTTLPGCLSAATEAGPAFRVRVIAANILAAMPIRGLTRVLAELEG